jgi:hypothetical protein
MNFGLSSIFIIVVVIIIIIINIISRTLPFGPQPPLADSARLVCSVVDYTIRASLLWISQQSKVVSLASKPQPGGLGPCICVPL